jgi:hypothetical protein
VKQALLRAVCAAVLAAGATSVPAVPVQITYTDGTGEGFNDPALGAQRKACFEAAVGAWAAKLYGTVPVLISASFDPKGGTSTSAILGSAGTAYVLRDWGGGAFANTWYPAALAANLIGQNPSPGNPMILASFNSDVDDSTVLGNVDWYYGLDGNPGADIDFFMVVMHEFGHGLGFQSFISSTGAYLTIGGVNYPAAYDQFLAESSAADAVRLVNETSTQRGVAIKSNNLWFAGFNARLGGGNINARIYAPTTYSSGSSVSHLNQATYQYGVNSLMCPSYTIAIHDAGPVGNGVFQDIGWTYQYTYTAADLISTLKYASGVSTVPAADLNRLNIVRSGTSASRVDLADAAAVARKLNGLG